MPAKGVAPRRSSREGALGGASHSGGDFEGETSNDMNRGHNLRCACTGHLAHQPSAQNRLFLQFTVAKQILPRSPDIFARLA